jgi:hypothetical protein
MPSHGAEAHQQRRLRVRLAIRARRADDDGSIRFRLGGRSDRQRQLCPNVCAGAERRPQRLLHQRHARRMGAARRCPRDDLPVDQLDPIVRREDAGRNHPLVFSACPTPCLHRAPHDLALSPVLSRGSPPRRRPSAARRRPGQALESSCRHGFLSSSGAGRRVRLLMRPACRRAFTRVGHAAGPAAPRARAARRRRAPPPARAARPRTGPSDRARSRARTALRTRRRCPPS